jgi:hypothetical protein
MLKEILTYLLTYLLHGLSPQVKNPSSRFDFNFCYPAYRLLVGKPEGKRPLGRPRRRWVDNIRIDLGEVG